MIKKIREIVSIKTLPSNAVTIFGEKYAQVCEAPPESKILRGMHLSKNSYRYHYRKLEQLGYFGAWKFADSWLSTNTEYLEK